MLDPWERCSFPLQVLPPYLIPLYRLRPTSIAWSILPWPWTETYYSGKDAHTRNKREGAPHSNNTIKGNAWQQTRQGAGLGKKEKAELKRDRPLWQYLLWRIHRWSRTTKMGDQFSLYPQSQLPFPPPNSSPCNIPMSAHIFLWSEFFLQRYSWFWIQSGNSFLFYILLWFFILSLVPMLMCIHTYTYALWTDNTKLKEYILIVLGLQSIFMKNMFIKISQKFNNLGIVNFVTVSRIRKLWKTDS